MTLVRMPKEVKEFFERLRDNINQQFGKKGKRPPASIPKVISAVPLDTKEIKKNFERMYGLK